MKRALEPVAWLTACAALTALMALFAPAPPLPAPPPPVSAAAVQPIPGAGATDPPLPEPEGTPASAPHLGAAGAVIGEQESEQDPAAAVGWGALLTKDPAAAFARVRDSKRFGPARRAPPCGALHPLPAYEAHLDRAKLGARTVGLAARYLQLAPWPAGLTPADRKELDLLAHVALDILNQAGTPLARHALSKLGARMVPEPEDADEFEHDCFAWRMERARLAAALHSNWIPEELTAARSRLVRWLLQHLGPRGRIGAPWVHEARWPCRTRAEEDGAPAEQVTALATLALLGELEPRRARDLLTPSVSWLVAALGRAKRRAHPAEGCNDDLCRCENLGGAERAIRAALKAAEAARIEVGAVSAALAAHPPAPAPAPAWPDPSTARLRELARAASQTGSTARWRLALAHRLAEVWKARLEGEDEACVDAIGREAPALEAAAWLLALRGLEAALGKQVLLPPLILDGTTARRVLLITPGAARAVRSCLIRELTSAGWRVVAKGPAERTVTLQGSSLQVTGGKTPRSAPFSRRDASGLRAALNRP